MAVDPEILRAEFIRLMTVDSETQDRRRKEYNQAIFNREEGHAIWEPMDIGMVMDKFDAAVKAVMF